MAACPTCNAVYVTPQGKGKKSIKLTRLAHASHASKTVQALVDVKRAVPKSLAAHERGLWVTRP